jgi:acetylornithine/succinyldiaminopimelate/putrescine aminotransferase
VGVDPQDAVRKDHVLARTREHVAPHRVDVWEAFGTQLVMGRREGYRVWDLTGRELLDFHLNGGTYNLGHRNAEVRAALVAALDEVDIGNHHFASEARSDLAAELARLTPGDLAYSVFASGGSEAIDIAIKTARYATGRRPVVCLERGYHGRTGLAGAAGEDTGARRFLSDQPEDFPKVPFADIDSLASALSSSGAAAVLIETVPATYGFPLVPKDYLPAVRALCTEAGALYIADEVQTGLGRTGRLWGVETFEVVPDILVTGKGLSGGVYPIAAAVLSPAAAGWLHEYGWGHVSTFGGSELGCRVALKVLEITTRPEVEARVQRLIRRYAEGLEELRCTEPYLQEVRQTGLVIGLRVDHPNGAIYLQQELFERGIWAIAAGFDQSVLQFKPGLLLDEPTVDRSLELLGQALRSAKDVERPVPSRHSVGSSRLASGDT